MNRTQIGPEIASNDRPEIRQAGSADRAAIGEFFTGLSARTMLLRFFTAAPSLTAPMLRVLAGGGDHTDVIVATERGRVIGHAMAVDAAETGGIRRADIGVVVADAWQGRGIGSALVRALTGRAVARGVTALAMDVLAENRRVLAMIARRWPEAHHARAGTSVTVHVSPAC